MEQGAACNDVLSPISHEHTKPAPRVGKLAVCGRNPGPTTIEWARGALPQTHVQAQCVRRYRILCKEGKGGGTIDPICIA